MNKTKELKPRTDLELSPCPFCNRRTSVKISDRFDATKVHCTSCHCSGPLVSYIQSIDKRTVVHHLLDKHDMDYEAAAAELWNTRKVHA